MNLVSESEKDHNQRFSSHENIHVLVKIQYYHNHENWTNAIEKHGIHVKVLHCYEEFNFSVF